MNKTIVGVDLAKKVIQVCIYTNRKVHSNTEMTPKAFTCWLVNSRPATIVFEACGTSNYWKQLASSHGHDARLISSRLVAVVRQNQKTDKNDALAIVQASLLPDVNFIQGKTAEQQQLQSIVRLRELSIRQKTASKNQLIALLSELNIQVSNRNGGLRATIDETLEDPDNGFSPSFRQAISTAWDQYLSLVEAIDIYDNCLEESLNYHPECKKLLKIEGIGILDAVNLYIALGCADIGAFSKGKAAAACIGLTPIQHSSGGRAKIGSIGRGFKNTLFRSQLITGAMSIVSKVANRPPKTKKEEWLKNLIERRGKKCAAVALANKNVRTAFAILTQGTEYKAEPLVS
ncbi:IS110 family transposase [Vibrio splendidus]|uniref:IS110 family transposase n=1 Tax=Vibrio splendidus TaxID=29497 RepID=UPI000C837018|nr:IS110 family transposase [Vibrio splendidus]PMG50664.1 transposase [Vibrio splendidus]